ncbi:MULTISPECIES: exopolysaccharide Pel transporter PelG [Bacillales]|jgi:uncharacterized membrane protein|uniref:Histidine kinase n=1 Tax=Brevibacillus aydinogluensis TaxID=927786 RepID=A0AA48MAV5_9BACL|nr:MULTISPECIES: exopolysaccharide Pel transporter PelG [Bacillales]REK61138.1 MAG: hypothetical protein DF221_17095 [Brevibacillus sp.]MBR8661094.1 exopolysaccharide Pel transporter PelG [Brevibacillus sp. NL20B1]MDT3417560.1 putative membrane protein [Brevibacillus aydinogluensis]NNV03640.1 hypothetical protein [Brevibacillus sp. MCWH]UFJ62927.1 exopolysaccharide Pel transporter PelG [Anoxybacillus sediminis]
MAGIGFQLKRLFDREGLFGRVQAISYASLVTVGPILSCMAAVAAVHWLLVTEMAPYRARLLFQAGTAYVFAFSFIVAAPFSMLFTRLASDQLYDKRYDELLPTFYRSLQLALGSAAVPAAAFLLLAPLELAEKLVLVVMYMELIVIWMGVVYVSAMKAYRRIAGAFFAGMLLAMIAVWLYVRLEGEHLAAWGLFAGLAGGFFVTASVLLWEIERFFRTPKPLYPNGLVSYLRQYPSLLAIGLFTAFSMYAHQFAQWVFHGEWLEGTFLLAPEYDVAVYYAVLSVLPTLVWFVVSVETAFYPKYRQYYDAILGQGSIIEIDRARREMEQVLIGEMAKLMGIQLVFSLVAVACGILYLPYIGFTAQQVDTFNILVMSFYTYIMTSVSLLLLLYFDDRKGALALSAIFLAANIAAAWALRDIEYQGLSLFAASFPVLIATLSRLIYRLRRLHYATFSAQPLASREQDRMRGRAG